VQLLNTNLRSSEIGLLLRRILRKEIVHRSMCRIHLSTKLGIPDAYLKTERVKACQNTRFKWNATTSWMHFARIFGIVERCPYSVHVCVAELLATTSLYYYTM